MGRKRYSVEFKKKIVELASEDGADISSLAKTYGLTTQVINIWKRSFELGGKESFTQRKSFNVETKREAVRDFTNGKGSLFDVCKKYQIPREATLRAWVIRAQNGIPLERKYVREKEPIQTTKEERIQIVRAFISSGFNYSKMSNPLGAREFFVTTLFQLYEDYGEHGFDDEIFVHKNYPLHNIVFRRNGKLRNIFYQRAYGWWKRHSPKCERWSLVSNFIKDLEKIEDYHDDWFLKKRKLVLKEGCSVWSAENCKFVEVAKKEDPRFRWIFVHEDGTRIPAKMLKRFAKDFGLSYSKLNNQANLHRVIRCDGWRGFRVDVFDRIKHILPTKYYLEAEKLFAVLARKNKFVGSYFVDFIENLPCVDGYDEDKFLTGKTRLLLKEGKTSWSLENCYLSEPVYRRLSSRGGDKMITMFWAKDVQDGDKV